MQGMGDAEVWGKYGGILGLVILALFLLVVYLVYQLVKISKERNADVAQAINQSRTELAAIINQMRSDYSLTLTNMALEISKTSERVIDLKRSFWDEGYFKNDRRKKAAPLETIPDPQRASDH